MEQYLNKGIKEIITEFPLIGKLLETYEIGCTSCQVGTCLLKDIVSIHNLSTEAELELFTKMAEILFPGQTVTIPQTTVKVSTVTLEKKMSPPLVKMVDEHVFIKKILALIPEKISAIDISTPDGKETLGECLNFIRNYADKYHHAKEEDLLFKYFDGSSEIIKVMLTDHVNGRNFVKGAAAALDAGKKDEMIKNLTSFRNLLIEHIKREDEILYPWMDREMNMKQVGELYSECLKVDEAYKDIQLKYERFANELSQKYGN